MSARIFDKYEGLGNDFVILDIDGSVDAAPITPISSATAKRICDRHFGIGADGVLVVSTARSNAHRARMSVINSDGSIPEMCGNGLRCVALHLARVDRFANSRLLIETDAGVRACEIAEVRNDGAEADVAIDMGIIRYDGSRATTEFELAARGGSLDAIGALPHEMHLADAGNPHAIWFGTSSIEIAEKIGPIVATHPAFPEGTNVEFAVVTNSGIDLVVWERGAGLTLACGTGACATAATACALGLASYGEPIVVRLPGGSLEIVVDELTKRATMRGPARHVFSGTIEF